MILNYLCLEGKWSFRQAFAECLLPTMFEGSHLGREPPSSRRDGEVHEAVPNEGRPKNGHVVAKQQLCRRNLPICHFDRRSYLMSLLAAPC